MQVRNVWNIKANEELKILYKSLVIMTQYFNMGSLIVSMDHYLTSSWHGIDLFLDDSFPSTVRASASRWMLALSLQFVPKVWDGIQVCLW